MVEWGQGERGGFRVKWEEKHKWLLNRDADQERIFYFSRRGAACIILRMP